MTGARVAGERAGRSRAANLDPLAQSPVNTTAAFAATDSKSSRAEWLILAVYLGVVAAVMAWKLYAKWYPHDEGALGQSAERVLHGQVPHRDFDEIYTGLLSYLNAGAFALAGVRAEVMRLPLYVATILWSVSLFSIARRFAPTLWAALVSFCIFLWSVPNYPAAIPSWYNLFCATFGIHALIRWQECSERKWLILAGVAGGVSFLFKLSGVFYLVGAAVAVIATHQHSFKEGRTKNTGTASALLVAVFLSCIVMGLAAPIVRAGLADSTRLLPSILIVCAATVIAERKRQAEFIRRVRELTGSLSLLAFGAAVPIAVGATLYAAAGGLHAAILGVLITPFRRVSFASTHPPSGAVVVVSLMLAAILFRPVKKDDARLIAVSVGALLLFVVVGAGSRSELYSIGWYLGWGIPFVAALGTLLLTRETGATLDVGKRSAFALAIVAAFVLLVEFPFAAPIYTLYALPLAMLAFVAIARETRRVAVELQVMALAFFLMFGAFRVMPGSSGTLGMRFALSADTTKLLLPRAGLRVRPERAKQYDELIPFVIEKARNGVLWAGPDSPEVYFLSGLPNHTRTLFDFLDSAAESSRPLTDRLADVHASVVVLNQKPGFSQAPDALTIGSLRARFSNERTFGQFLVLW